MRHGEPEDQSRPDGEATAPKEAQPGQGKAEPQQTVGGTGPEGEDSEGQLPPLQFGKYTSRGELLDPVLFRRGIATARVGGKFPIPVGTRSGLWGKSENMI